MQLCNHRVMDALGRFAKHNSLWLWRCLPYRLAKLQDYAHQDDHASPTYQLTTGFKPFTVFLKQALYHRNRHGLRTRQKGKRNMKDFRWYLITPTIPQSLAMLKQTALSNLHLTKKKNWRTENYYSVTAKCIHQTDDLQFFHTQNVKNFQ